MPHWVGSQQQSILEVTFSWSSFYVSGRIFVYPYVIGCIHVYLFSLHFNICEYAVILIDAKYSLQLNYVRAMATTRLQCFCWGDVGLALPNCKN
jgi:hypothetical protein